MTLRALALGLALPALALAARPAPGPAPSPTTRPARLHDLHETYADLAIEGATVGGRVRFYREQLEEALGPMLDADAVSLSPGAEATALVGRYLAGRLTLVADGDTLPATVLRTGEVAMEHHHGWEVTLSWEATAPIDTLRVRNTLLFEIHDDQRNIVRVVRLPEETPTTLTFDAEQPEAVVAAR